MDIVASVSARPSFCAEPQAGSGSMSRSRRSRAPAHRGAVVRDARPALPTQPFAPTRVADGPTAGVCMGGTRPDPRCAEQMAATAAQLASPHTPWNATRVQSRLPPAYDMGLLGASPSMMPPPACGINALTSLPPLDPSQPAQLGRLLASLIMPCLCSWGQHRTTADCPELLAFGPLPALHDALITSHTYSLTLPQLVTALKERAGSTTKERRSTCSTSRPTSAASPVPPAFWPHARPPARAGGACRCRRRTCRSR